MEKHTSMIIGYIRVSTDKQNQKHKILSYAHNNKFESDEFVQIEIMALSICY